jgi:hypothetical protein
MQENLLFCFCCFACCSFAALLVVFVACAFCSLLEKLVWKSINQRGNSMWKFENKRGIEEIKWKSTFMQEKHLML